MLFCILSCCQRHGHGKGSSHYDVWRAKVVAYNLPRKVVLGRFLVKEDELWIPERGSHNQNISFASILGTVSGTWLREFDRWQE